MPCSLIWQRRPTTQQPLFLVQTEKENEHMSREPRHTTPPNLEVAILAGGASRRFGKCKLLAELRNTPLIDYSLELAASINSVRIHIVTGRWHTDICTHLSNKSSINIAQCQNWEKGMGASLKTAIAQCNSNTDGLLVLLADQALISHREIKNLAAAWEQNVQLVCCARYTQTLGPPAIFPKNTFKLINQLPDNQGAKKILQMKNTITVDIPNAEFDIDTPEELALVQHRLDQL